jgi:HEAT repeat protein
MTVHTVDERTQRRIDAIREQPSQAAIEGALSDPHWAVRVAGAELAASYLEPERLVAMMSAGDDFARRASAMNALVRAGRKAVPALLKALTTPQPHLHVFCLQALSRIPCPESFEALATAARSHDTLVSQAALEGLGKQKNAAALPLLQAALGKDQWRALSAIVAMGHLGHSDARPILLPLLRDNRYADTAADALKRIDRLEPTGDRA